MFDIDLSPTYFWPVTFALPKEDGSGMQTVSFDAKFVRLDMDALDGLQHRVRSERMKDAAVAAELLVGWRDVRDKSGGEVPFSEGARARLLRVPGAAAAVVHAYFASLAPAAEKN